MSYAARDVGIVERSSIRYKQVRREIGRDGTQAAESRLGSEHLEQGEIGVEKDFQEETYGSNALRMMETMGYKVGHPFWDLVWPWSTHKERRIWACLIMLGLGELQLQSELRDWLMLGQRSAKESTKEASFITICSAAMRAAKEKTKWSNLEMYSFPEE